MSSHFNSALIQETCNAINTACKTKGGAAASYSCKTVSWDDAQRDNISGTLSCWGANITDTRLWEKSGTLLFTCRPDNWNETIGKVNANDIALVVGNHIATPKDKSVELIPITLADYLKKAGYYAEYAGLGRDVTLDNEQLDSQISIRFQTTFLPVKEKDDALSTLEFCTEAYNYNTRENNDPRNAILLCTTQGVAFQQDGAGYQKLFHHAVDDRGSVHRYWLEAEQSCHKVGRAQIETKYEAMQAAARGKATASMIGIKALGTRFNVLMTIQIPLQQKPQRPGLPRLEHFDGVGYIHTSYRCCWLKDANDEDSNSMRDEEEELDYNSIFENEEFVVDEDMMCYSGRSTRVGIASAARVSRGTNVNEVQWEGVKNKTPQRDPTQHITITVVLYNTVAGGIPSVDDVHAAIQDMEELYAACAWKGKLADREASFMTSELTNGTVASEVEKQPPTAPICNPVTDATVFPSTHA